MPERASPGHVRLGTGEQLESRRAAAVNARRYRGSLAPRAAPRLAYAKSSAASPSARPVPEREEAAGAAWGRTRRRPGGSSGGRPCPPITVDTVVRRGHAMSFRSASRYRRAGLSPAMRPRSATRGAHGARVQHLDVRAGDHLVHVLFVAVLRVRGRDRLLSGTARAGGVPANNPPERVEVHARLAPMYGWQAISMAR